MNDKNDSIYQFVSIPKRSFYNKKFCFFKICLNSNRFKSGTSKFGTSKITRFFNLVFHLFDAIHKGPNVSYLIQNFDSEPRDASLNFSLKVTEVIVRFPESLWTPRCVDPRGSSAAKSLQSVLLTLLTALFAKLKIETVHWLCLSNGIRLTV